LHCMVVNSGVGMRSLSVLSFVPILASRHVSRLERKRTHCVFGLGGLSTAQSRPTRLTASRLTSYHP
jgi:hypothetical protein